MSKINKSKLNDWMLVSHDNIPPYKASDEYFIPYFVLPTAVAVHLVGRAANDSRSSKTGEFADGHRLITGNLLALESRIAVTGRTLYELGDIHPPYRAWLEQQNWDGSLSVRYNMQLGDIVSEGVQTFIESLDNNTS